MKKGLSILLALVMILSIFTVIPFSVSAGEADLADTGATNGTTGKCTWKLDGTVLTISGNGKMGDYSSKNSSPWGKRITEVKIEYGVTTIGSAAFTECSGLTKVTIPGSVTSIGSAAFSECKGLTNVTIPDSVTSIGSAAFYECSGLKKVTNSYSITSIESYTFYGCSSLENASIPYSVTNIGDFAYYGCAKFEEAGLPNGLKTIGAFSYYNCDSITSLDVPPYVNLIGSYAFSDCLLLKTVKIPNSVSVIGDHAFYNCKSLNKLIIGDPWMIKPVKSESPSTAQERVDNVIVPDTRVSIGDYAFAYCNCNESLYLDESVVSIGDYAFFVGLEYYNLYNREIYIPYSVAHIGECAFGDNEFMSEYIHLYGFKGTVAESYTKDHSMTFGKLGFGVNANGVWDHGYGIGRAEEMLECLYDIRDWPDDKIERYDMDYDFDITLLDVEIIIYYNVWKKLQRIFTEKGLEPDTLTDESSGIRVTLNDEKDLTLSVEVIDPKLQDVGLIIGGEDVQAYNISLLRNDAVVQPEKGIKVEIPCQDAEAKVYRRETDGTMTDMRAVFANNCLIFFTDHFSVYVVAKSSVVGERSGILGDADGDGDVSILDATAIQRTLAKLSTKSYVEAAADADGDTEITINDATAIQRYIAQLPAPNGIGKPIA